MVIVRVVAISREIRRNVAQHLVGGGRIVRWIAINKVARAQEAEEASEPSDGGNTFKGNAHQRTEIYGDDRAARFYRTAKTNKTFDIRSVTGRCAFRESLARSFCRLTDPSQSLSFHFVINPSSIVFYIFNIFYRVQSFIQMISLTRYGPTLPNGAKCFTGSRELKGKLSENPVYEISSKIDRFGETMVFYFKVQCFIRIALLTHYKCTWCDAKVQNLF